MIKRLRESEADLPHATNRIRVVTNRAAGTLEGYWSANRRLASGLEDGGFPVVFASIGNADGAASDLQVARCKSFPPNT